MIGGRRSLVDHRFPNASAFALRRATGKKSGTAANADAQQGLHSWTVAQVSANTHTGTIDHYAITPLRAVTL
jgi:hypothetical protein